MIDQSAFNPRLRVFRKLDVDKLTQDFLDKVEVEEGRADYVDADRPRDLPYTEEIIERTIGAALVDAEGNILAEFRGAEAVAKAEKARSSARVTFSVDVDDEDADDEDGEVDPE